MEFKGIDISTWQGDIDWKRVENDGIHFAMIRSSYGFSGVDDEFSKNMKNIADTSIHKGAYHYCYAKNITDSKSEAKHFINTIKPYQFDYPIVLDLEDSSLIPLGKSTITDIAVSFCEELTNAGYYTMIYSNLNWLHNYIDTSRISDYDIWLAQWSSTPTYSGNFGIWQHTASGSVDGISGNVDMNISFKDYPNIIGGSGQNQSNSTSPGNNSTLSESIVKYVVSSGDTLWSIAEKHLGNGNRYPEIKSANNLTSDTIYSGQTLIIPVETSSSSSSLISYVVSSGDTLWDIAERYLGSGSRYTEIKSANNLTNDTIYPGQTLIIPSGVQNNNSSILTYTVVSGDTLWGIAEKYLGSGAKYPQIKDLNGLTTDEIYIGQTLKIPN